MSRPVTGILEHRGQQGLVKEQPGLLFTVDVVVDAEALLVLTCQQSHSRRDTDRGGDVGIGKKSTFFRESVDIRSGDFGLSELRQIGITHVIRQNEDDVWFFCLSPNYKKKQ